MDENRLTSISSVDTLEKVGECWDTHDFADFDTDAPDVQFDVTCAVPIEVDLFASIEEQARKRGVSIETLVNVWLAEKMAEQKPAA